mmetsp:Transcript_58510/g.181734  ORF Transcript_58510/g.181734 Transcript_58510/m.181734 type:complete len:238 (+) Transcript_58510:361-1074(+)
MGPAPPRVQAGAVDTAAGAKGAGRGRVAAAASASPCSACSWCKALCMSSAWRSSSSICLVLSATSSSASATASLLAAASPAPAALPAEGEGASTTASDSGSAVPPGPPSAALPASWASPLSLLSSPMVAFCASKTRRCWEHMSFTAANIRKAPSNLRCIFTMCASRRLPLASRVPMRFWSCLLRARSMRASSSSSPSPRLLSSARMAAVHVCWSSADSRCNCARMPLLGPSSATKPS